MINFAQYILDKSQQYPEKIAMNDGIDILYYGDLKSKISQVVNGITNFGIKKNDHVIICLDDCVDWPIIFFACLHQGIVPLPLSPATPKDLFLEIADFIECKAIFINDRSTSQSASTRLTVSRSMIQSFYIREPKYTPCVMSHPDAVAYMNVSSGSTGMPKVAVHRHQTLFEILKLSPLLSFGMTHDSIILSTPKMSWNYGLQNSVTYTFGLGATAIVIPQLPVASVVFEYINQFKPNIVISSPSIIRRLLAPKVNHFTLPDSIKHFNSSGEHLPSNLYDAFKKRFGITLSSCIGMMETCTNYAANSDFEHDPGTVGRPLPGCKIKLVDNEIYVSSPANACYYYKNFKKTKQTFIGEWIKTGDKGHFNENGNLIFDGRLDDIYKVNDLIVSPIEIEDQILKDATVDQVAVTGIKNEKGVTETHAFIIPGYDFDQKRLQESLISYLLPHQLPRHWHIVQSLPETNNNKKTRKLLANFN